MSKNKEKHKKKRSRGGVLVCTVHEFVFVKFLLGSEGLETIQVPLASCEKVIPRKNPLIQVNLNGSLWTGLQGLNVLRASNI